MQHGCSTYGTVLRAEAPCRSPVPKPRAEAPRRSPVRSGWGQRYRRAVRICSTTPVSRLCSRVSRVTRLSKASRSARASVRKRVTCLSKASRSARASSRRLCASACQASRPARASVRSLPVALPLPPVGAEVYRRSLLHRAAHEPRRPLTPLLGARLGRRSESPRTLPATRRYVAASPSRSL